MLLERQQLLHHQQQKHLARKIHDDVSQKMTLLSLQLSMAATDESPPRDWAKTCQDWANLLMDTGRAMREIINELQPRVVDEYGLTSALRWFAQTLAKLTCCTVTVPPEDVCLDPFVGNELFAICREVVLNVLIPAQAPRIEIELQQDDESMRILIRPTPAEAGAPLISPLSLHGMAVPERLLCLNGTAAMDGSVLILSVPSVRPAVQAAA